MTMVDEPRGYYAYPLVTWGATLLGAVVAVITSAMLNLLGASLGIAAMAIGQSSASAATTGIVGIAWVAISNLIALGFGAWVAGRSTANPDHHGGTLQGIAVWAVTSLVVLFLAGSAISGMTSAVVQTAGAAANASSSTLAQQATRPDASARAEQATQDTQAMVNRNADAIKDTAVKTAGGTAVAAFGAFLAMALGLASAILGARMGARHPTWSDRPRYREDRVAA